MIPPTPTPETLAELQQAADLANDYQRDHDSALAELAEASRELTAATHAERGRFRASLAGERTDEAASTARVARARVAVDAAQKWCRTTFENAGTYTLRYLALVGDLDGAAK